MDWDLKATSWDFTELETESEHNFPPLVVSTSSGGEQKNRGDCSVDLKLGRFEDFGDDFVNKWKDPRVSTMVSSSPLATMKRARVCSGNGAQIVSCLVDGCNADLSKCRDYHRRHKVCEVHSKTPRVSVNGQEQRFCQQCSRFHMLVEFDEVKRSCRKRLDGHNRRRRKPQPESLSMNSGSLFSYHQGARLLPFANPPTQVFPSTAMTTPTWRGVVKTEEETMVNCHQLSLHYAERQNPFSGFFSPSHKGGKQFPFLQVNELGSRMVPEVSVCQPLINNVASSENVGTARKMFSDELTRVLDSDCALSLLSSPPTQRSGISLSNHVVQPDSISMSQPLVPELHYNNGLSRYLRQGMYGETMGSVLVSDATDAELNCQDIFHMVPNGSSQNGMPQTLPFCWE